MWITNLSYSSPIVNCYLEERLAGLQKQTQVWRAEHQKDLREKRKSTEIDEEWLDGVGNLIDEEQLMEKVHQSMRRV
jgi:hypothetical protein